LQPKRIIGDRKKKTKLRFALLGHPEAKSMLEMTQGRVIMQLVVILRRIRRAKVMMANSLVDATVDGKQD
jgi:hypothetical protein